MYLTVIRYLVGALSPLIIKTLSYVLMFRLRSISATLMNCIIIAAAPIIVSMIPLPQFLAFVAGIGAAIFLCAHYTEAELFPDAILIPVGVEILSFVVLRYVLIPLIS